MASPSRGFTLLELIVVLAIGSLLFALGGTSAQRFYESMQYRDAVRTLASAARNGRMDAFANGVPMDLVIDADRKSFALTRAGKRVPKDKFSDLAGAFELKVTYALEVSARSQLPTIRFYPGGGSSGGEIVITREEGSGTQLTVDWLLGEVVQVPL